MKIIASKSDLQTAVNIAIRAVPAHTTMPILQCILIQAEHSDIVLTSNDMELGIETHMNGTIEEPGTVAIDAKMLSEIVRKISDESVCIETDENHNVKLTCGKACFSIGGRSGEDFSYLPNVERDECVTISQFTLKQVILQTIFSIATNENNQVMNGELFEINGDTLRVVALDGHRIAIRRVALKETSEPRRVIVPGKTLLEISRILSGEMDEMVHVFFSKNHMVFEIPGTKIVTRLIDGEYFNVDQMISADYETKVVVNRNSLLGCIDRASLFVREGDKKPIIFEMTDNTLSLSIDSPLGSMNESLDIEKEGKDMVIGFNPKFMMDALKAVDDENVTMYLVNPKAPCFIRDEEMTYTYLILPVNFTR